jgi:hypothetical protein
MLSNRAPDHPLCAARVRAPPAPGGVLRSAREPCPRQGRVQSKALLRINISRFSRLGFARSGGQKLTRVQRTRRPIVSGMILDPKIDDALYISLQFDL